MIQLVEKFIHHLKYYPNSEAFKDHYLSHPNYPSLYAVTDTLDFFDIENIAARVTIEQFTGLPSRFLTLYHTGKGEQFVYVTQKNESSIDFIDEDNNSHKVSKNEFITNWREIIVAIDENKNIALPPSFSKNMYWAVIITTTVLLLLFNQIAIGFSIISLLYSTLSVVGLCVSILLIQESFGINNEITSKICGVTQSDAGGCKSVLNSSAAVIYKNFTLSDACFCFFTALTFLSIFSGNNFLHFIPISILSIPVVVLSIYYQKTIIKKWCALCLGISAILFCLSTITFLFNTAFFIFPIISSTTFFIAVLALIIGIWVEIKPLIAGYFTLQKHDREHKQFKRNVNTFSALLETTQKFDTVSLLNLYKIEVGGKTAATELILFLSPSCGHCHIAFKDAIALYEKNRNILKLAIYFNVNIENELNEYRSVVEIILENHRNTGNALELLKVWHTENPTLEEFVNKYKIAIPTETRDILQSHYTWCNANEFNYSPVRIFNRKLMPNEYSIPDIGYFIREFGN